MLPINCFIGSKVFVICLTKNLRFPSFIAIMSATIWDSTQGEGIMSKRNLTLLTDLYELTMMQGYFKNPTNQTVIFDMFYRTNPCGGSFAITAGLEQMIEYIENLRFSEEDITYLRSLDIFEDDFLEYLSNFRFTGDIYAIPEGTVIFPREPMVKVQICRKNL